MANQQELMQQALSEMKQASVGVDRWLDNVIKKGKPYYEGTHVYKALKALEAAKKANPNVPANDDYLAPVRRVLILTDDITHALDSNYLLCATADLNYRKYYTDKFIKQAIAEGRFRVWCDCRPAPDGTPPQVALDWLKELGLPPSYFYGQCESAAEFDNGYAAGARKFVGKVNELRNDQLALLIQKKVLMTNEAYYNVELPHNGNFAPDWKGANAGIGGNTVAVYESDKEGAEYLSLQEQAAKGYWNPEHDCIYVEGFGPTDWPTVLVS